MAFPDDMSLDDGGYRGESLFPEAERPTTNERLRRTERIIKESPDYVIGKMMAQIVRLTHDVNRLNHTYRQQRPSIRPQVQSAGVGAGAAAIVTVIYQVLHQAGVLK
jgi:hypothetical protein